ncbi:transmembrane protein 127-like [Saccostrea echinata]|uniref:transmembrane protein 127-like n=1 Tax=Saccostrea echinata TaxID=191078 RepID=UPI002A7FA6B5|nr:transmembrane protein 127-like [Saccostrea echinata]XP_061192978.1 transmembrane protein 127-like [Saccostrea echinata]
MPRSNRSRSSGRESHRSRTRSRHRSSSRRISRRKLKEKNFWSALCSMVAIVIMCTSLAEPRWISLHGGGCRLRDCVPLDHIGAYQFFYSGHFLKTYDLNCPNGNAVTHILYQYGDDTSSTMDNCVTHKAVSLMKTIISFTFLALLCTLCAFILDLVGPTQRSLKIIHRNAIFNIIAVILCVITDLFCYWLVTEVLFLQKMTKLHTGSKVTVTFDISFYLIAAAGGMGVFATALNCLRRYPVYEDDQSNALLEEHAYDCVHPDPGSGLPENHPPPPPYSA